MNILHVITGMRKAAGTSVFCGEVCTELVKEHHKVFIAVCDPKVKDAYPVDVRVHWLAIRDLSNIHEHFDIVHIHALWHPVLHRVAVWAKRNHYTIVWSPHGMLTRWAFRYKWWKKFPAWYLYQKNDLKLAAMIHVTVESEAADVHRVGLNNRITIVPLGVRIPEGGLGNRLGSSGKKRILLYVGRVARIKCLDQLLQALAIVQSKDWCLRIVGPNQENHMAELRALAEQLGISDRIDFAGPRYDAALTREYVAADCFILPSHSENFGSVVLEALAVGLPVIASTGTPWKVLEERACGMWVRNSPEMLASALTKMFDKTDDERREMGERGRMLVQKEYTWQLIANELERVYSCLIRSGSL